MVQESAFNVTKRAEHGRDLPRRIVIVPEAASFTVISVKHPHLRVEYLRDEVKRIDSTVADDALAFVLHLDNHVEHRYAAESEFDKFRICELLQNLGGHVAESTRDVAHKHDLIRHGFVMVEIDAADLQARIVNTTVHTSRWMELTPDALVLYQGPRDTEALYIMMLAQVVAIEIPRETINIQELESPSAMTDAFVSGLPGGPSLKLPFHLHLQRENGSRVVHRLWSRTAADRHAWVRAIEGAIDQLKEKMGLPVDRRARPSASPRRSAGGGRTPIDIRQEVALNLRNASTTLDGAVDANGNNVGGGGDSTGRHAAGGGTHVTGHDGVLTFASPEIKKPTKRSKDRQGGGVPVPNTPLVFSTVGRNNPYADAGLVQDVPATPLVAHARSHAATFLQYAVAATQLKAAQDVKEDLVAAEEPDKDMLSYVESVIERCPRLEAPTYADDYVAEARSPTKTRGGGGGDPSGGEDADMTIEEQYGLPPGTSFVVPGLPQHGLLRDGKPYSPAKLKQASDMSLHAHMGGDHSHHHRQQQYEQQGGAVDGSSSNSNTKRHLSFREQAEQQAGQQHGVRNPLVQRVQLDGDGNTVPASPGVSGVSRTLPHMGPAINSPARRAEQQPRRGPHDRLTVTPPITPPDGFRRSDPPVPANHPLGGARLSQSSLQLEDPKYEELQRVEETQRKRIAALRRAANLDELPDAGKASGASRSSSNNNNNSRSSNRSSGRGRKEDSKSSTDGKGKGSDPGAVHNNSDVQHLFNRLHTHRVERERNLDESHHSNNHNHHSANSTPTVYVRPQPGHSPDGGAVPFHGSPMDQNNSGGSNNDALSPVPVVPATGRTPAPHDFPRKGGAAAGAGNGPVPQSTYAHQPPPPPTGGPRSSRGARPESPMSDTADDGGLPMESFDDDDDCADDGGDSDEGAPGGASSATANAVPLGTSPGSQSGSPRPGGRLVRQDSEPMPNNPLSRRVAKRDSVMLTKEHMMAPRGVSRLRNSSAASGASSTAERRGSAESTSSVASNSRVRFADEDEILNLKGQVFRRASLTPWTPNVAPGATGVLTEEESLQRLKHIRDLLLDGKVFKKYSQKGKPHNRRVFLTPNQQRLVWEDPKNPKHLNYALMPEMLRIRYGHTFVERGILSSTPKPDCTFTLVCTNRVLELETASPEECKTWAENFQFFIEHIHDLPKLASFKGPSPTSAAPPAGTSATIPEEE